MQRVVWSRGGKGLLHRCKMGLHWCEIGFGWCKRLLGDLCSMGQNTFCILSKQPSGVSPLSDSLPGSLLCNSGDPFSGVVPAKQARQRWIHELVRKISFFCEFGGVFPGFRAWKIKNKHFCTIRKVCVFLCIVLVFSRKKHSELTKSTPILRTD